MKKFVLFAFFSVASAGAQAWNPGGPFRDEFLGCARLSSGAVECSVKSQYTGNTSSFPGAEYFAQDTHAQTPDGRIITARRSAIQGIDISRMPITVFRNTPVTVVYTFDYPTSISQIRVLSIDGGVLRDVAIKGSPATNSPATSAPVPPPPSGPAPVGTAAPVKPTDLMSGAFDLQLSGCTPNAQGGFSCTRAEITPKR